METRAHHLLIGSFMLLFTAGVVAFVIWLAKVDVDQDYERYHIFFEGSVAGLTEGSAVRLNGVPVGTVLDISIPRDDPSRVRVLVRIEAGVPILEGSTARLELQGFTGLAFVQVSGGQGAEISAPEGQDLPVIPSERSPIQQVFEEAPNLINEAILAINNLKEILGPQNQQRIGAILADIETISGSVAARAGEVDRMLAKLDGAVDDFRATAGALTAAAESAGDLLDTDLRRTLAEATKAARRAESLAAEMEGLVAENREGVSRFVNSSLPEASRLIADMRRLALRLNRIAETFEERPAEALFGANPPEYRTGAPDR